MPLPPPPPPPPPPLSFKTAIPVSTPNPPTIAAKGPPGALLLELNTYNGSPFNDHWAYFVRSSTNPDVGVAIEAIGDVGTGFRLQIERNHDFSLSSNPMTTRIPLQWVDAECVNEQAMLNNGVPITTDVPVCSFEESLHKVKVPEKTLNSIQHNKRVERVY
ncbi:hypothetical protein F66182_3391 [Fusarium sp. NRRL 66182]|nr:hypothetical protein F66182_3391 [Fusarium sp. NRRL 66182]